MDEAPRRLYRADWLSGGEAGEVVSSTHPTIWSGPLNPFRTADVHEAGCLCFRCDIDTLRNLIAKLEAGE